MRPRTQCSNPKVSLSSNNSSSLSFFDLLFKLVDRYLATYSSQPQKQERLESNIHKKGDRSHKLEKINEFLVKMQFDNQCKLDEDDKMDCLFQSLEVAKKITIASNRNNIETRSKRLSQVEEQKTLWRLQMLAIQNMAELILAKMLPAKKTVNTVSQLIITIIQNLYEYKTADEADDVDKKKTKKIRRYTPRDKVHVQCQLQSGTKIDLVWYLLFRIIQRNLEEISNLYLQECRNNKQFFMADTYSKYVNAYVKQIVHRVILHDFAQTNLPRQFLKVVIGNAGQMQLPIIVFFLKQLFITMQQKFCIYYETCKKNSQLFKVPSKELHSLQSISIWLELIQNIGAHISEYNSCRKHQAVSGLCSYCGVSKSNTFQRLIYQQIRLSIDENHNLVIKICENCCKLVGCQPSQEANLKIFGPLVLSRFWNVQLGDHRLVKVKEALKGVFIYHDLKMYSKKDKNRKIQQQTVITDRIAMNNQEESVDKSIIQQLYHTVLFTHSNLSIKSMLISTLNILITYLNSSDDKVREKSVKVFDKAYIHQFIFGCQNTSQKYHKDIQALGMRIISAIQQRLSDSCPEVSIASLQCLTNVLVSNSVAIQTRNSLYESICKSIIEQHSLQYHKKALSIMERIISRFPKGDIKNHSVMVAGTSVLMKTLNCLTIIAERYFDDESPEISCISEEIANSFHIAFKKLNQVCSLIDQKQVNNLLKQIKDGSFFASSHLVNITSPDDVVPSLVLLLMTSANLNKSFIRVFPQLSYDRVIQTLNITNHPDCDEQTLLKVENNICILLELVYQDVIALKEEICSKKRRSENSNKNIKSNLLQLRQEINSAAFIHILIEPRKETDDIPNSCLLRILCKLLEYANFNQLINQRKELVNYMMIWARSIKKKDQEPLNPIVGSSRLQQQLKDLAQQLLESIKYANYADLQTQVDLIAHLKMFLGPSDQPQLSQIALRYQKYCYLSFDRYMKEREEFSNSSNSYDEELQKCYIVLNRCCYITTFLVTRYQYYLIANKKFTSFYEIQIAGMVNNPDMLKSVHYRADIGTTQTTGLFKRVYSLSLNVLELGDDQVVKRSRQLQALSTNFLSVIKSYWAVHSSIIFSDDTLLNIIKKIDESTPQGFATLKTLYQVFGTMLPSTDMELLNFIRNQFSKKIQSLIRTVKNSHEFMETCFNIIFHLLKSGMEGLYAYSKYIFFGLLHQSIIVKQTALRIIKQVYTRQSAEKILFINLKESLELVFSSIFELSEMTPFSDVRLTEEQQQSISILSELTRANGNVHLAKEKKQLKLRLTFAKKMGGLLASEFNMIRERPVFFTLMMKILKSQKMMDYCELIELLFCFNKLISNNQAQVEGSIQKIKVEKTFKNEKQLAVDVNYLLAFRELLSCVAYLAKYQDLASQIKQYQNNLEKTSIPYVQLEQVIMITSIREKASFEDKINLLEHQITVFLEIVIEGVENMSVDQSGNSLSMTTQTVLTKKVNKNYKQPEKKQKKVRAKPQSQSLEKQYETSSSIEEADVKDNCRTRLRKREKVDYRVQYVKDC